MQSPAMRRVRDLLRGPAIVCDGQATIREAEGRLEAAKREAEAQIRLAEASAKAITDISEAIKDNDLPAVFLLGDRYINTLQKIATSQNSKLVILPSDLPAAIRGLMGKG